MICSLVGLLFREKCLSVLREKVESESSPSSVCLPPIYVRGKGLSVFLLV